MADAGLCQIGCVVEATLCVVITLKISFRINDSAFRLKSECRIDQY